MAENVTQKHHQSQFQYTALGNSVAFGTGATNNYGYVDYIRDFLKTQHNSINLINRATSGFTSSDLLDQLQQDTITRDAVKNANGITISIGGANLLKCLHTPNLPACLVTNVALFSTDWPQILSEIRTGIQSNAELCVMTVYNPFIGNNPLYHIVEYYIQQINNVIQSRNNRSIYRYKVVDVHKDFQGQFTDGIWKVCAWTHFCEFPPDPHPNDSGHLEIAYQHKLAFYK